MQIRTRLTLQFVLIVTIIVLIAFGLIYYSSAVYRKNELYQRLENKAITCAEIFISVDQIDSTMLRVIDRNQRDKLPFETISIYNINNRLLYSNNDTLQLELSRNFLDGVRLEGRKEFAQKGLEFLGITYNSSAARFVVFAGGVDIFGSRKLNNLRSTLILLFFTIISILAVAGWIYSGRALKPLSMVVNEVEQMEVDKLDRRLNHTGSRDEIGRLIGTFNFLLDRIESSYKLQKLFLSGASHELKNPITSIISQLQVALLSDRSGSEYKQIISSILEDIMQLNRTTNGLIEFAKLSYEKQIQLNEVRVDDVLWSCKDYFQKTNPDYKIEIRFENMPKDSGKLLIKGNADLLKVAFINITDNACKFSNNRSCKIDLSFHHHFIVLSFRNTGTGLTEEELRFIFEPFYRSNPSAEKKGHGIGLALTRKIIQLHGARISVKSEVTIGTKFNLFFRSI